MVRFLGFCSRTCIGDQRLSILFNAICGTHVLVTKPIYQNKQKKVTIRKEIMKLLQVAARRGENRDLKT